MKSFLKHFYVPTLADAFSHWSLASSLVVSDSGLELSNSTLQSVLWLPSETAILCSNQESIMKHCLLQYQTCEVSAPLIGRENILPSSGGRA